MNPHLVKAYQEGDAAYLRVMVDSFAGALEQIRDGMVERPHQTPAQYAKEFLERFYG